MEPAIFDQLVLTMAAHLVAEAVVVEPVLTRVLARPGLAEAHEPEIRRVVRYLAHAASALDDPDRFVHLLGDARDVYSEVSTRVELEVLSHLHRVFDDEEQRRLALAYPDACDQAVARYRSSAGHGPAWTDPVLLDVLGSAARDELGVPRELADPDRQDTVIVVPEARAPRSSSARRTPAVQPSPRRGER